MLAKQYLMSRQRSIYEEAKRRVAKKKGFYKHLGIYIIVGLFFYAMNMVTDPNDLWFFFPLLPWGVGLGIHYLSVFGLPGTDILSKEWEEKQMEEELSRLKYQDLEGPPPALQAPEEGEEEQLDLKELEKRKEKKGDWDEDDIV